MSVTTKILKDLPQYLSDYYIYKEDLEKVLYLPNTDFKHKQDKSVELIQKIMEKNDKELLCSQIKELAEIELESRELEPWRRDHVVHAISTFTLGIYFQNNILSKVNTLQWKLAALFHDIGYPLEISNNISNRYLSNLNRIKNTILPTSKDIPYRSINRYIEKLENDINPFDLIQEMLNKWNLSIDVNKCILDFDKKGRVCHGVISAQLLLWAIDLLYQKYNPDRGYEDKYITSQDGKSLINANQKHFMEDVVPACAAIFIHNLPSSYYEESKISPKFVLPYLLKLSDSLQQWERPSDNNNEGHSAFLFDINYINGTLYYSSYIEEREKYKTYNEITTSLELKNVILE